MAQPMTLKADEVYYHPNAEGCATAGFKAASEDYVLLSRGLESTTQDSSLGVNEIHLEVSGQSRSCYGGISRFTIFPEKIEIELNSKGITETQQEVIVIGYELIPERRTQLRTVLGAIFSGFPDFTDIG